VHEGAVYTAQSVGMVTRSDVRDGRVEWVYEYATDKLRSGESFSGCGSAPMVVDDLVICQPRDSNWIFALDRMTGQLVWKNVMISPRLSLGLHAGRILLLGSAGLVALDVRTGAVTWEVPVREALVAWPQRVGASIVLGTTGGLRRIDAGTGEEQEAVPWPGIAGHIGNFAVHGGRLYLVTDVAAPGEDVLPLPVPVTTPAKQDGSFPAVWKLLRPAPVLYVPASDAAAGNRALVYHSGNILECFELSATGAVAWAKMTGPDLGRVFFHNSKAALVFKPNAGRRPDAITGIDGIEMETGMTIWRFRPMAGAYVVARCGPVLVLDEGECFGALDLDSGKVLWRKSITDFKADFGQSRAMVLGNTLHVLHRQGGTLMSWMKIDPLTGTLLESKTLAGDVSGDWALAKTSFGEASCYLETAVGYRHSQVYRTNFKKGTADLVFDGVSMDLYAQDHVLLRQDNMRQLFSSADTAGRRKFDGQAIRCKAMGGKLLFVTEAKTFTAIDMESGKDIWKFTEADHTRLLACGEGDGDRLFVATYDNKRTSITLAAYRISDGAKLWSQESMEGQAPAECSFHPAGLNSVSGTGTWLASGNGLLWLCWNDGLYAYPDGGGASPP